MRTLLSLGSRAVAMGMTILLTVVVAKYFGDGEGVARAGAFNYAFALLYLVATITRFGAETHALRLTAADPALGRPWARPALLWTALLGVAGVAVLTPLVATVPAVGALGGAGWLWAAVFATAILPVNLVTLCGAWLRALGHVAVGSYVELAGIATLVVGVLGGAWLTARGGSLPFAFATFAVAAWVVGLVTLALTLPRLAAAAPTEQAESLREYLRRFGRPLAATMATAVGFFCYAYLATLYLGALHREADVAQFNVARMLANFVPLLATLQASYLSPQFAALQHAGDGERLHRLVWTSTAAATGFGLLVAVPLLVWPEWLLSLAGHADYAAAAGMLRVLVVGALLTTALGQVYSLLLTRPGLERKASGITMMTMSVAVLAMMAVTPLGRTWVVAASLLAPVGFAVAGHVVLARRGVPSAIWQLPGGRR